MASHLLRTFPILLLASPAWADHGGLLASAPMSPITLALLAGGLAFVTVLLLVVIVRPRAQARMTAGRAFSVAVLAPAGAFSPAVESSVAFTVKAATR